MTAEEDAADSIRAKKAGVLFSGEGAIEKAILAAKRMKAERKAKIVH